MDNKTTTTAPASPPASEAGLREALIFDTPFVVRQIQRIAAWIQSEELDNCWVDSTQLHTVGGCLKKVLTEIDEAEKVVAAQPATLMASAEAGAMADIAAERQRQKDIEGWTPHHDDTHHKGELAAAAACYAFMASKDDTTRGIVSISEQNPQYADPEKRLIAVRFWPWEWSWFKLKDRRRDLIRAGALIVAEIERLDRATSRQLAPETITNKGE